MLKEYDVRNDHLNLESQLKPTLSIRSFQKTYLSKMLGMGEWTLVIIFPV